MTGTPGEALDTDEALTLLAHSFFAADDAVGQNRPQPGGDSWWFAFLSALNDADVVLVWDGPAKPTTDRPGGWVPGIGWVARQSDLGPDDLAGHLVAPPESYNPVDVVMVVARWADGTVPTEGDRCR